MPIIAFGSRSATEERAWSIYARSFFKDPREAFTPLRDPSVFKRLFIDRGALCWPDGPDIAPEYIYFLAFQDDEAPRDLFEKWGYVEARVLA